MKEHTSNTADGRSGDWEYACLICGSPYRSKPVICHDCRNDTIAPISRVLADSDQYDR